MRRPHTFLIATLIASAIAAPAVTNAHAQDVSAAADAAVTPEVPFVARAFPLGAVQLLDGPFRDAMRRDAEYLFSLDPDRLLYGYFVEAGLEPKGESYSGWETDGLAGHTSGHYLSAISMYYAVTRDSTMLARIRYMVDEMARIQERSGDGYTSAIPGGRELWSAVKRGDIKTSGFRLNGVWAPWYTMHKQLAGLLDAYRFAGYEPALDVARKLGSWAYNLTADFTDEQWQNMLACEHGGMNEALADLYGFTGHQHFMDLSRKFHHQAVLGPMAHGIPNLTGLHSNTQIPKVIGLTRQYELIGDDSLKTIADFFWDQMVADHTYAIGGNSMAEFLGEPGKLSDRLDASTAETCNTYNMLRLTRHLLMLDPKVRYGDYYERALYNHILASQDPETGMFTYYMSLRPGHYKTYSNPETAFWCCVGSGMENHVRYGESIYFEGAAVDDSGVRDREPDLYVNLFIASTLEWRDAGLRIVQDTGFPFSATTTLRFESPGDNESSAKGDNAARTFKLLIRHPSWAVDGLQFRINGERVDIDSEPGSWAAIERDWKPGDSVGVTFPMRLRTESMPDNPARMAILYGPIVLGGLLGTDGMPEGGAYTDNDSQFLEEPVVDVPVLVADPDSIDKWLVMESQSDLRFRTVGAGRPHDVTLLPFFEIHGQRYTVYWDVYNESDWAKAEDGYLRAQREQRRVDSATIDIVRLGEMLGEQEHALEEEKSESGVAYGRKFRVANRGGWFSFSADRPAAAGVLRCTYWGGDRDRSFQVLANGEVIASESLVAEAPNRFFDREYGIPAMRSGQSEKLTFTFRAAEGAVGGRVFGCRVLDGFDDNAEGK